MPTGERQGMKSIRYRRYLSVACLLLLLAMGVQTWRDWHRSVLNHTLLHAVRNNDNPLLIDALKQGADPNARGDLTDVAGLWHPSLLDLILRRPSPTTQFPALMIAALNGNADNLKTLVQSGADVNVIMSGSNIEGCTALLYAAMARKPDMVKVLLEHGANVHVRAFNGHTALSQASAMKRTETIRLLKQAGATE
jgi:ankyrin repeat protein